MRRHGWQRPLHPLQIVGMAVYSFILVAFYAFLGPFLGNRVAEITILTLFSFVAVSVMLLFIRCTLIDPSDRTRFKKKRTKRNVFKKLNYGSILAQIVMRFLRRMERKILKCFIRSKYLDPWKSNVLREEPLLPFLLVLEENAVAPDVKEDDTSFCSLCNFEGMRTYDYILAMKEENQSKVMQTLDDLDSSSDDSSNDSPEKPKFLSRFICDGQKTSQEVTSFSVRIDKEPDSSTLKKKPGFHASIDPWKLIKMSREKTLMAAEMGKERLVKQKLAGELKPPPLETKCGPLMNAEENTAYATGSGTSPLMSKGWFQGSSPFFSSPRRRFSGSSTMFPSTILSSEKNYRSSFDLKLTEVSRELENHISKQAVCSVLKKEGDEASPAYPGV
ncbi:hypothetical protein IFM89_000012 [Coptis chinensis]|uniref:Uncharacterized protein n=1 Tax=Coptis chinensis TaxID=261450 RepID=A0A835IHU0_9MAGN|nr:hypothetical protein IFM89_000012 [Coptis chinensis]